MTILVQLENYYRERGIWPAAGADFGCEHLTECMIPKGCEKPLDFTDPDATLSSKWRNTFTPGHSAYVGARYGDGVPRLLFVQLDLGTVLLETDPGYNLVSPESRTPEGIRKMRERLSKRIMNCDARPTSTVEGTNAMATAILRKFSKEVPDNIMASPFYARANAVKCTMNKDGREQADGHLYKNCQGYLRGEIDRLSPAILVTHGGKARHAVERAFREEIRSGGIEKCAQPNTFVIKTRDGRRMFWLNTYHPSRRTRPKFDAQMNGENSGPKVTRKLRVNSQISPCGLDGYAKLIHDFVADSERNR